MIQAHTLLMTAKNQTEDEHTSILLHDHLQKANTTQKSPNQNLDWTQVSTILDVPRAEKMERKLTLTCSRFGAPCTGCQRAGDLLPPLTDQRSNKKINKT